jgi:uncharacterized surface protein with fasciclin (FAS1) repeats
VSYHVIDNEVFSSQLQDGQTIRTLLGEELVVEIDEAEQITLVANTSRATIIEADQVTSNGVVHIIDGVLQP